MNTTPWMEGTLVNELPLPSRARSPTVGLGSPSLPSVPLERTQSAPRFFRCVGWGPSHDPCGPQ